MRSHRRAAFTLPEILVVMTIMAVLGIGFVKLVVAQLQFSQHEFGKKSARAVARSAMNLLVADLRMVQDSGGVDSVSSDRRTVRVYVPYAFGLVCSATAGTMIASLLPVDSTAVSLAKYGGYAWRDSTKRWRIVTPTNPGAADSVKTYATPATCTGVAAGQAGLRTMSLNGRTGRVISVTPGATGVGKRTPIYLWQKITYSFAASTAFPGLYGLYRTPSGGASEEIMAPFDSTSAFQFYVPSKDNSKTTIPALSQIRGFDVVLSGASAKLVPGQPRVLVQMVTGVFFKNTRSF